MSLLSARDFLLPAVFMPAWRPLEIEPTGVSPFTPQLSFVPKFGPDQPFRQATATWKFLQVSYFRTTIR
jgi:hypothetical protein